ncbi:hypothetical protein [Stenotrophomonas phage BUCT603B1]|nr:hypothetical protein [Stenotrophomonas phage BUCT603]UOL49263.1 hypothetical protein [Stenotrophomonas phage BUCT603B1]HDS1002019.1 HK97 gp10 family phage protein [Stenotrophomonas maltophilia]
MKLEIDTASVMAGLADLQEQAYSVARTMGAAVGAAMRDEAKSRVRSDSGRLAAAIVVKFAQEWSTKREVRYIVTWNRKKAPHGHLVEFGHWRTNVVTQLPNGQWITTSERLEKPVWVAAKPFLRPAQAAITPVAMNIATRAGAARWNELSQGGK